MFYQLLLGILEDNSGYFVLDLLGFGTKMYNSLWGYPFASFISSLEQPEPLFFSVIFLLFSYSSSVWIYNTLSIFGILLSFILSFKLLSAFLSKKLAPLLALIFTISPHFLYCSRSHINMIQLWLPLLSIYTLLFYKPKKLYLKYFLTGILLTITVGVSNYLAYFTIIFISLYFFSRQIISILALKQNYWTKQNLFGYFLMFFTTGIFTFVMIRPYIMENFLGKYQQTETLDRVITRIGNTEVEIVGDSWKVNPVGEEALGKAQSKYILKRPIEDFFTFSLRPWYFFLPSIDNPFFGHLTQGAIHWLQNDKGFWLAQNYFPSEHSAGYLGWVNFSFAIVGLIYVLKKVRVGYFAQNFYWTKYHEALSLGMVALAMALLSMPPYITINLSKIYLPSYILFRLFPMFRVLSRMGVFILLVQLIFTGFGYISFLSFIEKRFNWRHLNFLAITPFFIISLMEFFIPLRLTDVSTPPKVFTYISQNTQEHEAIAVYPYSKNVETLFWTREHKRPFTNTRDLVRPEFGFDSKEFTAKLPSHEGILEAHNLGIDYLVYFPIADKNMMENCAFFAKTPLLEKIGVFEEYDPQFKNLGFWSNFIHIENYGTKMDSTAILYRIR